MPQYPKLDQKTFDYLPEPFKQAIIADGRRPIGEMIEGKENRLTTMQLAASLSSLANCVKLSVVKEKGEKNE